MSKARILLLVITTSTLLIGGIGQTPASAENRCGSWEAGEEVTTSTSTASFFVKGDNDRGLKQSSYVAAGRTANSYGICDADFVTVNTGDVMKISFGKATCVRYRAVSTGGSGWVRTCSWSIS